MHNITEHYENLKLVAVADLFPEKAKAAAEKYHVPRSCSVEELLQDRDIQIVLNLTIPAAHYSINKQILEAGKHVYCEKPLSLSFKEASELISIASEKGLMCMSAPDTFLGAGIQTVQAAVQSGKIGKPFGFTANMTCSGHEIWHPNPGFYYKAGGGPLFDMGPYYLTALIYLLGPIRRISSFITSGRPVRHILDKDIATEVPTTYTGILEFVNGAIGTMTMSFDTWHTNLPLLEIYGTEGSIGVPDPNNYSGKAWIYEGKKLTDLVGQVNEPFPAKLFAMIENQDKCTEDLPMTFPVSAAPEDNMRGLGVSDMAQAIIDHRAPRLSSAIALHTVEALNAFEESAKTGKAYEMTTTCQPTQPMDQDAKLWEIR